jgi:hypothetical protein
MSPERGQELGLDTHFSSSPEQPVSSSKRLFFRLSSVAPPPYTTGPPTPNVSGDPSFPSHFHAGDDPRLLIRPTIPPEVPSRRLPTPPIPRYVPPIEETTAGPSRLEPPPHVTGMLLSSSATTSFDLFTCHVLAITAVRCELPITTPVPFCTPRSPHYQVPFDLQPLEAAQTDSQCNRTNRRASSLESLRRYKARG